MINYEKKLLDAVIWATGSRFPSLEEALDTLLPLMTTYMAHSAMVLTYTKEAMASSTSLIEKQELAILRVSGSLSRFLASGDRYPLSQTYCTSLVATREPLVLLDVAAHPQYQQVFWTRQLDCNSFMGVPLVLSDERCYGILCALDLFPGLHSQASLCLQALQALAAVLCAQLEQEKMRTRLRELEQQLLQTALSEQQTLAETKSYHQQAEAIFQNMTDGLLVYDTSGNFVRINPAARAIFAMDADPDYDTLPLHERSRMTRYRDEQGQDLAEEDLPISRMLRGEKLSGPNAVDIQIRALDGHEVRLQVGGAPLYDHEGHIVGAVAVKRDVTERRLLEKRFKERTNELYQLIETMTDGVAVFDREGNVVEANRSFRELFDPPCTAPFLTRPLIERRSILNMRDEQGNHLSKDQCPLDRILHGEILRGSQMLDLHYHLPDDREVILNVSGAPIRDEQGQVAWALLLFRDVTSHRRLEQHTQQVLDTLLSITELLVSASEPHNVTPRILIRRLAAMVNEVLDSTCALVVFNETDKQTIDFVETSGLSHEQRQQWLPCLLGCSLHELFTHPAPYISLLQGEEVLLDASENSCWLLPNQQSHNTLLVPLKLGSFFPGLLCLIPHTATIFTEQQRVFTRSIARWATLILERERLMRERTEAQSQAQRATTQERERMARELHDSISQAFFAISLEAQRAEDIQEMDQESRRDALEIIIALAEMGQAQLWTLLFELREETLEREGLIGAMFKEVTILRTRYGLAVETELGEEPALSPEDKHVLYRIAREALHNVVKHAYASRVNLRLVSRDRKVVLVIQDNGRGFDPSASFPGHLGLRSMRERIAPLQGEVSIESCPGQGTTLTISFPTKKSFLFPCEIPAGEMERVS